MRAIDVFLRQLDETWQHPWESLMPTLEGVTEEEAAWQAPCYRSETGTPAPGTILWHVVHLAHCKRAYTARIDGRDETPTEPPATFAVALDQLQQAHQTQREAIAALEDDDLGRTVENGMRLDEFLTSTIRHDSWHAAQIAVARRLWRTRES